jgi:hypothetical protein
MASVESGVNSPEKLSKTPLSSPSVFACKVSCSSENNWDDFTGFISPYFDDKDMKSIDE